MTTATRFKLTSFILEEEPKSDAEVLRERLAYRMRHFRPAPGVTLEEGSIDHELLTRLAVNDTELHQLAQRIRPLDAQSRQPFLDRQRELSAENQRLLADLQERNR